MDKMIVTEHLLHILYRNCIDLNIVYTNIFNPPIPKS